MKAHWSSMEDEAEKQDVGKDEIEFPTHRIHTTPKTVESTGDDHTTNGRTEERLLADSETYRLQTVDEERLIGVVTHKLLRLVKVHAG